MLLENNWKSEMSIMQILKYSKGDTQTNMLTLKMDTVPAFNQPIGYVVRMLPW